MGERQVRLLRILVGETLIKVDGTCSRRSIIGIARVLGPEDDFFAMLGFNVVGDGGGNSTIRRTHDQGFDTEDFDESFIES